MGIRLEEIGHPSYLERLEDYELLRDFFKGSRAVKAKGNKYLPRLTNQSNSDYDNYKNRALVFPITGKTVSSLVGFATYKLPKLVYPSEMESLFGDTSLPYQFLELEIQLIQELLLMGRFGLLIDAPVFGSKLPTICPYIAENIINWSTEAQTGKLLWVLLQEVYTFEDSQNKFKTLQGLRYRWCGLIDGVYHVSVYDEDMNIQNTIVPLFQGKSINYVPFVITGSSGLHAWIDTPPMLDIATINLSHYLTSADLEWGRHFVGLPTPVVTGVDASTKLKIGGTTAWILPDPTAKASYLEFIGEGLGSLEKALQEKIGLMASVSARLVDTSTRGSEAAETVRLRYLSETASLNQIMLSTENALNTIYKMISMMLNLSPEAVSITLEKDVLITKLTAAEIKEIFQGYLSGLISKESLIYNLRKSGFLDPGRTDEQEISNVKDPVIQPKVNNNVA